MARFVVATVLLVDADWLLLDGDWPVEGVGCDLLTPLPSCAAIVPNFDIFV